ncbi:MAG: alpha-amylase family glycosyl hydrolase [Ignavibacteriaceae bacterium]
MLNPKLYEINTRVWIKQFGENRKFNSIPINFFQNLSQLGINIVWLMGIWKTCPSTVEKYCFEVDLISSYNRSLKDWRKNDVIGSPFAIDIYEVNPALGSSKDLLELKKKLNDMGIKLFLDFIPNHFSADSSLVKTNPGIFLEADEELMSKDPYTFFKPCITNMNPDECKNIFAHGRDPLFPAWRDTIQINFFKEETRDFMIEQLIKISDLCDGVRCDMAMLPLNNVFNNTWAGVLNRLGYKKPLEEFWKTAIEKVKAKSPEFIFMAESYWDLEWNLQQLGFDFTYDKRLTDRLAADQIKSVVDHLKAEKSFQLKSVRFLENHDEKRAVEKFGKQKSLAAAAVISTIQGMKFYFDGQFEGKKIKLPLQLGREPNEKVSETKKAFYTKLLKITKDDIFTYGEWSLLKPIPINDKNYSYSNLFTWQWKYNGNCRIIAINYSGFTSQCRLKFQVNSSSDNIILFDLLNDQKYIRRADEISESGLYIELKAYNSHIFALEVSPS